MEVGSGGDEEKADRNDERRERREGPIWARTRDSNESGCGKFERWVMIALRFRSHHYLNKHPLILVLCHLILE